MSVDWSDYNNFSKWEFDCSHTGLNKMRPDFLDILQQIRTAFDKPMIINSGYRHITHPLERVKRQPGEHFFGVAADINVAHEDAMELYVIAYGHGIRRLGLYQNGHTRFIHIGMGDKEHHFPPTTWTPPMEAS